jgi:hypothetical protein
MKSRSLKRENPPRSQPYAAPVRRVPRSSTREGFTCVPLPWKNAGLASVLARSLTLVELSLGAASTAVQAATCVEEYCYDSVGRLNAALLCGTEYSYTYDAAGNRTGRTVSAGTSPLVCDADSDEACRGGSGRLIRCLWEVL